MLTDRHTSSVCELTDTHPVYVDRHTTSVRELTDTHLVYVN